MHIEIPVLESWPFHEGVVLNNILSFQKVLELIPGLSHWENITLNYEWAFIPWNMLILLGYIIYQIDVKTRHPIHLTLRNKSVENFLAKSGFIDYLNTSSHNYTKRASIFFPFHKLWNMDECETLINDYIWWYEYDNLVGKIFELVYNAVEHGRTKEIYLCGQKYPRAWLIDFTIYDAGIGMTGNLQPSHTELNSLSKYINNPDCFVKSIWLIPTFLILCICTSFSTRPTGWWNGLRELSTFLKGRDGYISICSWNIFLKVSFKDICKNDKLDFNDIEIRESYNHSIDILPGTYIAFIFRY